MRDLERYLAELIKAQLENRVAADLPMGISVDEIVQIANRNQMKYLLLGALVRVKNVPEEQKDTLRLGVMQSIYRTACQMKELKELEIAFEDAEIMNQPLKGSIMKFVYPSPEMREMSDIDMLIEQQKMEMAQEILKDRGYILVEAVKHHDIYKCGSCLVVEAHRAMYDKTVDRNQYGYFGNFSRTSAKVGCTYTQEFGKEDFYVYMMSHMAKHFYQMGCGVRHLVDIYVYLNKYESYMNREYVECELDKCGILMFTKRMEELAYIWLDGKQGEKLHNMIFSYMLDSGIYGKDENGIWNKFAEEKKARKKIGRLQLKAWYFFPPLHYMSEYFPYLEEKPWLLPWAWLVRGVNGVLQHKGTDKRKLLHHIEGEQILAMQTIYSELNLKFKS